VLSYGEGQLAKLMAAGYSGTGDQPHFESMAMHAGSILLLAMGVSEILKVSCFGFLSAAKQKIDKLENFPPAKTTGGWASIQAGKPVIAFAGDGLPAGLVRIGRTEAARAWTMVGNLRDRPRW